MPLKGRYLFIAAMDVEAAQDALEAGDRDEPG